MTDKKDGPAKGPERGASEPQAAKRPFATLDLKATEVKVDDLKAKAEAKPAGTPTAEAATAAKVAAAAKAVGDGAKAADPKAAEPKGTDPKSKGPGTASDWSVETALGDRKAGPDKATMDAAAAAAVAANRGSGFGRFLSHATAGVLGGALTLAAGPHILPLLGIEAPRGPGAGTIALPADVADRIAAVERAVRERPTAPAGNTAQLEQSLGRIEDLTKRIAALGEAQAKLEAENTALKDQIAKQGPGADALRVTKLEEQLATIAAAAQADPARAGRIPQLAQLTGQVRDLEAALQSRLAALKKELAQDIETRIGTVAEVGETAKSGTLRLDREVAGVKTDTSRLTQRLDQLKVAADKLDELLRAVKEETGGLKASLDAFKGETDQRLKQAAKPADIAAALNPVSQKVFELERSLVGVLRAEDDRKSNTERIVLSLELGNLKRAMERGARYTAELAEVRRVAGDRIDLKALERYAADGVPTLATLVQDFKKIGNAIMDAEAEQPGASVMDRMMVSAKSIVRVRKAEYAADDKTAEAVVTRMEAALKDGKLADVLAEANKLTDKSRGPAVEWLKKVEARQTVDAALLAIDTALKSSLGAGPRPADPAPAAPKGAKQ